MTHIIMVRHGTTEWMEQGRVHGRLDSRLSERGRQEARQVAAQLRHRRLNAFYTSPLGRTRETAAAIAAEIGLQPVVLDDLREMDFGWLEGRRMLLTQGSGAPAALMHQVLRGLVIFLTGERWSQVKRRAFSALRLVVEQHPNGCVLIVAHSGIHSAILSQILHGPQWRLYPFSPCGITEIEMDSDGRGRLIALNQTQHLEG